MTRTHTARTLILTRAERRVALNVLADESLTLRVRTAHVSPHSRQPTATHPDDVSGRIEALDDDEQIELTQRELDELRQAVFTRYRVTDTRPVALLSLAERLWDGVQFGARPLSEVYG